MTTPHTTKEPIIMADQQQIPGRLVDGYGRPWIWSSPGYRVDCFRGDFADMERLRAAGAPITADGYGPDAPPGIPLDELTERFAAYGPFRPVVHRGDARLDAVLTTAGPDALRVVAYGLMRAHVAAAMITPSSWSLIAAGRPGSWETVAMMDMLHDIDELAGTEPAELRAHAATVGSIILSWIYGGGEYVEVAETLASIVGTLVDDRGGWHAGYFATAGLARFDMSSVLSWLTSRADHCFDRCVVECSPFVDG